MKRHGFSHGTATLVTVLASSLLVEHLREQQSTVTEIIDSLSNRFLSATGLPIPVEILTPLLIGAVLAGAWGVAFAVVNDRMDGR